MKIQILLAVALCSAMSLEVVAMSANQKAAAAAQAKRAAAAAAAAASRQADDDMRAEAEGSRPAVRQQPRAAQGAPEEEAELCLPGHVQRAIRRNPHAAAASARAALGDLGHGAEQDPTVANFIIARG